MRVVKEKYLLEEHKLQMEVFQAKKKQDESIYLMEKNILEERAKREKLQLERDEELFMMKKKLLKIQLEKAMNIQYTPNIQI